MLKPSKRLQLMEERTKNLLAMLYILNVIDSVDTLWEFPVIDYAVKMFVRGNLKEKGLK